MMKSDQPDFYLTGTKSACVKNMVKMATELCAVVMIRSGLLNRD